MPGAEGEVEDEHRDPLVNNITVRPLHPYGGGSGLFFRPAQDIWVVRTTSYNSRQVTVRG